MIYGRNVFGHPVKNYPRRYGNILKITTGHGDYYTPGCLLDYPFFKKKTVR